MSDSLKYQQIVEYIRHAIDKGEFKTNDQIPTEEELCKKFGFSRMTVNKALAKLTDSGYITRIPGKGSFVSSPHVTKDINEAFSFTEDMAHIGLVAGSKLLSYELIKGSSKPSVAKNLQIDEDDFMHYFVRLRTGNNIPIAISYTYISTKIVPAIDISSLNNSFYEYLKSIGINPVVLKHEFRASLPTPKQQKLLQADNIALLCSQHISYTLINDINVPFEYIETYYNGDTYTYSISNSK